MSPVGDVVVVRVVGEEWAGWGCKLVIGRMDRRWVLFNGDFLHTYSLVCDGRSDGLASCCDGVVVSLKAKGWNSVLSVISDGLGDRLSFCHCDELDFPRAKG